MILLRSHWKSKQSNGLSCCHKSGSRKSDLFQNVCKNRVFSWRECMLKTSFACNFVYGYTKYCIWYLAQTWIAFESPWILCTNILTNSSVDLYLFKIAAIEWSDFFNGEQRKIINFHFTSLCRQSKMQSIPLNVHLFAYFIVAIDVFWRQSFILELIFTSHPTEPMTQFYSIYQ